MKAIKFLFVVGAVSVVILSVAFRYSVDFRYSLAFTLSLGYFDFLGDRFLITVNKILANCSKYYLERDFLPNEGRTLKIHEFDCSEGATMEKFAIESFNFTRPVLCKGLLKGAQCTKKWSLDYFSKKTTEDEIFRSLTIESLGSNRRRAFMKHIYPTILLSANETLMRMKNKEPIFVSFDNKFLTYQHPEITKDMELDRILPGVKFILNTLFISNFAEKTLASSFHFAPNDNFFFQCKGKKHWYFVKPKDLKYVGAYISRGVGFVSNFVNEEEILNRLTIFEGIIEESDVLYNPPYWLHAVGTSTGETFSVANRFKP
jgi:hypothetical protein